MRLVLPIFTTLILTIAIDAATAKVTHVSDGDSFVIASGERVRMIGVNAPELADPFGRESKAHLTKLIRGETVTLTRDPDNDDRDVHGRLLRFVTLNGTDINHLMIADGYASALLRYPFARARRDAYRDAENSARSNGLGIWAVPAKVDPPRPSNNESESGSFPRIGGQWIIIAGGLLLILLISVLIARR